MLSAAHANPLPPLPVVVPLLGAALVSALRSVLPRRAMAAVAIAIAALHVTICALLLRQANAHTLVYWFGNWFPRGSVVLGIGFVVDPMAAALALLAGVLFLLAFVFSYRFVDAGAKHSHPLMLVFLAAMSGFVLTGDLFNLFVWFELMSTAAFALCGLKTSEPAPLQGSFNFAVTNTIAAFLGLTGIALVYAITGALNMAQIGLQLANSAGGPRHDPLVLFAFVLLLCGFFIKGAIVPFHLWLPDAHAVTPTSVCVLFSGLMVELGLYAVARLHTVIFAASLASHAVALRGILFGFGGNGRYRRRDVLRRASPKTAARVFNHLPCRVDARYLCHPGRNGRCRVLHVRHRSCLHQGIAVFLRGHRVASLTVNE